MTTDSIITAVSVFVAFCSVVALAVKGRFDVKRGEREVSIAERAQSNADAKTTNDMLREQVDLLRQHRDEREVEIKTERAEWREREKKLEVRVLGIEQRVKDSERAYRDLVLTITKMGLCVDAAECKNFNPGGRRLHSDAVKPGGTD